MKNTGVASRYAKSLLQLAVEQKLLEEVYADMKLILDTMSKTRELGILLKSPIINPDKKVAIIEEVFGPLLNKLSLLFITTLVTKGREDLVDIIAPEFLRQYRIHKNIVTAKVTTAVPLDNSGRKKIS